MRKQIPNLIVKAHKNALDKGFWKDVDLYFHDRHLMLIVGEMSESIEALRINKFANALEFNNSLGENDFNLSYEQHIKHSFQDEMADICIRIFDFIAGFDLKIDVVQSFYEKEIETLSGTRIDNVPSLLFSLVGKIIDVKRNTWKAQYLGEIIGTIEHIMNHFDSELLAFIDLKMKYNSTRPYKHNKSF